MQTIAAIDLGSNSFHLLIATLQGGSMTSLYECGKRTQLGLAMDNQCIQADAIERGLDCLREYMAIIQQYSVDIILTAATAALRLATNSDKFCIPAAKILNTKVDIISGEREAELIYLGVISTTPMQGQQMVIDIGGGSTEFILGGYNQQIQQTYSLNIGCLSHFQAYYPNPKLNKTIFDASVTEARALIRGIAQRYRSAEGHICLGCSGVIEAVSSVLKCHHWGEQITLAGLEKARESLLSQFSSVEAVEFQGLKSDRRSLYVAGLAITIAIFKELKPSAMIYTQAALREGLIYAHSTN